MEIDMYLDSDFTGQDLGQLVAWILLATKVSFLVLTPLEVPLEVPLLVFVVVLIVLVLCGSITMMEVEDCDCDCDGCIIFMID